MRIRERRGEVAGEVKGSSDETSSSLVAVEMLKSNLYLKVPSPSGRERRVGLAFEPRERLGLGEAPRLEDDGALCRTRLWREREAYSSSL